MGAQNIGDLFARKGLEIVSNILQLHLQTSKS
jgi:hypothetical protein